MTHSRTDTTRFAYSRRALVSGSGIQLWSRITRVILLNESAEPIAWKQSDCEPLMPELEGQNASTEGQ
jgi:hypothetical protein